MWIRDAETYKSLVFRILAVFALAVAIVALVVVVAAFLLTFLINLFIHIILGILASLGLAALICRVP